MALPEHEPGQWKEKYRGQGKKVMINTKTGEQRISDFGEKEKQMIRDGDLLQPIGKDKDKFIEKYQHLEGEDQKDIDKFLMRRGLLRKEKPPIHKKYY